MSITIEKYVRITSAVGAGAGVRQRDLILRIFSPNSRIPANAVLELTSADDALMYFGAASDEYRRAAAYFGFVSKSATRPKKLSFVLQTEAALPARIFGARVPQTPATMRDLSPANLSIEIDGETRNISDIDLSDVVTHADVAIAVQSAIRDSGTGQGFTAATVHYDVQNALYILRSGIDGEGTIDVLSAVSNDAGNAMNLTDTFTARIISDGSAAQTPLEALQSSIDFNNNFASFVFSTVPSIESEAEITAYNVSKNNAYLYCRRSVTESAANEAYLFLGSTGGTASTYSPRTNEHIDLLPAALLAATDFMRPAANKNYMYQTMGGITPSVTDTPLSNRLDAIRTNYYGRTQTAGQNIDFYQRGVMFGGPKDPSDINIYVNEIWFKDRAASLLLALMLNLEALPANDGGRGLVLVQIQEVINDAINNGVISVGKVLTVTQRTVISELTNDERARFQVQDQGYWVDCQILPQVQPGGNTEYVASYLVIYSKGDAIRSIEGSHILI